MKIDFFIAGFQKAATTKLKDLIARNSHVCMHQIEEMTHFIDEEYTDTGEEFFFGYYDNLAENKIIGAKNVSMAVSENSVKRLVQHNPQCKIILVLRDPIVRAYSAYWYCRRMGWETADSFESALKKESSQYPAGIIRRSCDYLGQSYYAKHITMLQNHFPKEQIKTYVLEEDFRNMDTLNEDLCSFLETPVEYFSDDVNRKSVNGAAMPRFGVIARALRSKSPLATSVKKIAPDAVIRKVKLAKEYIIKLNERAFRPPIITQEQYERLNTLFKERNKELEKLLGRSLAVWKFSENGRDAS